MLCHFHFRISKGFLAIRTRNAAPRRAWHLAPGWPSVQLNSQRLRERPVLPVASARPRDAILLADVDYEEVSKRLGPHGPKLPNRPLKKPKLVGGGSSDSGNVGSGGGGNGHTGSKQSGDSGTGTATANRKGPTDSKQGSGRGGGGKGGGGGGGGGGGKGRGPLDSKLAALTVYTGLVGTAAIVLAHVTGIDLWGSFDWTDLDDLRVAATFSVPLQALNCAIMLPSYTTLRLPDLTKPEENLQVKAADAAAAAAAAAASSSAASTSDPTTTVTSAPTASADEESQLQPPAAATSPAEDSAAAATADSGPGPQSAADNEGGAAEAASLAKAEPAVPQPPAGFLPAASWGSRSGGSVGGGMGGGGGGKGDWTEELRSALHLAQGYYISNNPTAKLSPVTEAAVAVVDVAAGELLYRGVALTWLAGWLRDRVMEAGLEDAVLERLPAALGGSSAGEIAAAVPGVFETCECAVTAAVGTYVVLMVMAKSRRAVRQLELVLKAATEAAKRGAARKGAGAGKESGGKEASGGSDSRGSSPQVIIGPGLVPAPSASGAGAVMYRAAAIQAARDLIQVQVINAVFIATGGNLAASYTASLVNQLVISALQRQGVRRMKERSAALAKELKAYNAKVQAIAARHREKLPQAVGSRLGAMEDADKAAAAAAAATSSSSSDSSASADGGSSAQHHSSHLSSNTLTSNSSSSGSSSSTSTGSRPGSHNSMGDDRSSSIATTTSSSSHSDTAAAAVGGTASVTTGLASAAPTTASSAAAAGAEASWTGTGTARPAGATSGSGVSDSSSSSNDASGSSSSNSSIARRSGGRSLEGALARLDQLVPEQLPKADNKAERKQRQ